MKKWLLLLTAFAIFSSAAHAVIVIRKLPILITKPGKYILSADLAGTDKAVALPNFPNTPAAIVIQGFDIDIDLSGFSLLNNENNPLDTGILIDNASRVRIHNGAIRNFHTGITCNFATPPHEVVCDDLVLTVPFDGIKLGGDGIFIRRCAFHLSGTSGAAVNLGGAQGIITTAIVENCGVTGGGLAGQTGAVTGGGCSATVRDCNFVALGVGISGDNHIKAADNTFDLCTTTIKNIGTNVVLVGYNQ